MILVTGATGTVGSEVVKQLRAKGAPVRALVRDPVKAATALGEGVELAQGDLLQPATIDAALADCDHVFVLTAFTPDQLTPQSNAIDAAARRGGIHVVKMGVVGTSAESPVDVARQMAAVDERLQASSVQWTVLQPHSFMQNLLGMAGAIAGEGVLYGASGEGLIASVDTRDIAAVAVAALTEEGHVGKTYVLTGPGAISYSEMAAVLSAALGKEVRYVDLSEEDYRASLQGWGLAPTQVEDLVLLYARIFRDGHGAAVSSAVQDVTGRPARRFDEFVRDHVSAFRG
jgi:uncharacterized protein YbjT (DUF2867 family)